MIYISIHQYCYTCKTILLQVKLFPQCSGKYKCYQHSQATFHSESTTNVTPQTMKGWRTLIMTWDRDSITRFERKRHLSWAKIFLLVSPGHLRPKAEYYSPSNEDHFQIDEHLSLPDDCRKRIFKVTCSMSPTSIVCGDKNFFLFDFPRYVTWDQKRRLDKVILSYQQRVLSRISKGFVYHCTTVKIILLVWCGLP